MLLSACGAQRQTETSSYCMCKSRGLLFEGKPQLPSCYLIASSTCGSVDELSSKEDGKYSGTWQNSHCSHLIGVL